MDLNNTHHQQKKRFFQDENSDIHTVCYHYVHCAYFVDYDWNFSIKSWDTRISLVFWDSDSEFLEASKACCVHHVHRFWWFPSFFQPTNDTTLHLCLLQGIIKGIPLTLASWPLGRSWSFVWLVKLARWSMYGIFAYIWQKFMITVGKYRVHGGYGVWKVMVASEIQLIFNLILLYRKWWLLK